MTTENTVNTTPETEEPKVLDFSAYLWTCWDLAAANHVDNGIGVLMFIGNVETARNDVPGGEDVDWPKLKEIYDTFDQAAQINARKRLEAINHECFKELVAARQAGDREAFTEIAMNYVFDKYKTEKGQGLPYYMNYDESPEAKAKAEAEAAEKAKEEADASTESAE